MMDFVILVFAGVGFAWTFGVAAGLIESVVREVLRGRKRR